MLQYLGNILLLIQVDNLSCDLQDKVTIGLWHCWGPVTSSKMATKMVARVDFSKSSNLLENAKLQIHFARVVSGDKIKHFATFGSVL